MKKKKALVIVLAVLLLGLAGLVLSGCDGDRELAAPTGLEITNDVLTWKAVEGADGYTVEVNGEEYKTQNNSLDLFEITNKYGTYEIRVAADSVTEGVLSSDWSEQTSLTLTMPDWLQVYQTADEKGFELCVVDKTKAQGKLIVPSFIDGKAVVGIKANGFYECAGLTGLILPDTVEYIDVNAFEGCEKLTRVRWSAGLRKINSGAFDCTGLETLVLPEGVTFLGGNAFGHAKLKSVSLPSTVAKMTATNEKSDANPFAFCENLEEIYVAEGNKAYKSDGNCVMRREDNTLVAGCKASKIPSYTEHIGRFAFQGAALESVALPEGVTSIEDYAFAHNDRLKEITLPQSLTSIGNDAFLWCAALGKIAIPDGVTSVGDNAFSTCVSLKELALGAELLSAGCGLTEFCVALEKITVSENNESFSGEGNCLTRKADNTVIAGCASSKIPAGTEQIGEYAFCGQTQLGAIDFPDGLKKIGHYAFSCTGLKELKLPRGLQRIGSHAFGNCIELEYVQIPDSVTDVGSKAFVCEQEIGIYYDCTSMTAVITDSLTELKEETFISLCTIYTSHTAMPDGWKNALLVDGFRQAPKVVWGCELALDEDGLPYVVSAPLNLHEVTAHYLATSITGYAPERNGWVFKGWATEPQGEAEFVPQKTELEFNPVLPERLDFRLSTAMLDVRVLLYFYHKTYEKQINSIGQEQREQLYESGTERLYAVWEKI
ncbi:MAG TPA: hypothetical protein DHG49_06470 [Clostridiales bacterium]|nr:hypothetical protein [Clostridiales bacterium]